MPQSSIFDIPVFVLAVSHFSAAVFSSVAKHLLQLHCHLRYELQLGGPSVLLGALSTTGIDT